MFVERFIRRKPVAVPLRTGEISEYERELDRRIMECIGTRRSNCIGTALYLSGELSEDRTFEKLLVHDMLLKHMEPIETPRKGCIIAWTEPDKEAPDGIQAPHMGIVLSEHPFAITHRLGKRGEFVVSQPFDSVNWRYGGKGSKIIFRLPRNFSASGN